MKIIYNVRLLLLAALAMIASFSACKKDNDDANSGATVLQSFGPTGAMHGDTIKFIGLNLSKVTEIDFTGEGAVVPSSAFVSQANELITVVVPDGTEAGYVTLKTADGDLVSKTIFNLEVVPVVTSITAEARPGENITITGKYLNWVTAVTFVNNLAETTFVSQSLTELVVKVPDNAQTGKLVLNYSGTEPEKIETTQELVVTLPQITGMAPNPVLHGSDLTITGTNLDLAKSIIFSGVSTPVTAFVSQAVDKIVVKVPGGTSKGKVTLVAASGVSTQSSSDLDIVLPVASAFAPNPVKHQTNLTITGTNMNLVDKIKFPGVATEVTSFVSQSTTQVVVKVPSETTKGKVTLYTSGVPSESAMDLDVLLPAVSTMSPNPVDIGANLTITGTNLDLVTGVSLPGLATPVTSFVSQSPTQLVVKVPTGTINGKLIFKVLNSTLTVQSPTSIQIVGYVPPGGPAFPIYDEGVNANWNGWIGGGWGGTVDLKNTSPSKNGSYSAKISYTSGGYGVPMQLGGANISLAPYSTLRVSIYGGTGSNGKSVNIGFNEKDGKTVTIVEGKWTDFDIPFGEISPDNTLKFLYLKNYSASGDFTIYVDDMGLN